MKHPEPYNKLTFPVEWKKQVSEIDGCHYTIRYCPGTEEITVTQSPRVLVGYRSTIGDVDQFPELMAYGGSGIDHAVAEMLITLRPKRFGALVNSGENQVLVPKRLNTVKEFNISGVTFTIAYDFNSDLITIFIPEITAHAHRRTLEVLPSELKVLHQGKLFEEIQMFIFEVEEYMDLNLDEEF